MLAFQSQNIGPRFETKEVGLKFQKRWFCQAPRFEHTRQRSTGFEKHMTIDNIIYLILVVDKIPRL